MAKQIQAFATNSAAGTPRRIDAGLFVFSGDSARQAVKFGPFDAAALEDFARSFSDAQRQHAAGQRPDASPASTVLNSPLLAQTRADHHGRHEHRGAEARTRSCPGSSGRRSKSTRRVSVHFVAFDVDAKVFDPVKKLGATVVGAADEKQLNTQLEFILQRKILLEEEEPNVRR